MTQQVVQAIQPLFALHQGTSAKVRHRVGWPLRQRDPADDFEGDGEGSAFIATPVPLVPDNLAIPAQLQTG